MRVHIGISVTWIIIVLYAVIALLFFISKLNFIPKREKIISKYIYYKSRFLHQAQRLFTLSNNILEGPIKCNLYSESFPEPLQLEVLFLSSEFYRHFICTLFKSSSLDRKNDKHKCAKWESVTFRREERLAENRSVRASVCRSSYSVGLILIVQDFKCQVKGFGPHLATEWFSTG